MTWSYSQASGELRRGGFAATGYSGHGDGRDNPAADAVAGVGPIPRGHYAIGAPHDSAQVGPFAMALTPLPGTDTHGRSAFLMHGDNRAGDHSASHGCIIMPRPVREHVWASGDHVLAVTA